MRKIILILLLFIIKTSFSQIIVDYSGFKVYLDTIYKTTKYSYYILTQAKIANKSCNRASGFKIDERYAQYQLTNKDYSHSNYDKGHLSPAEDFRYNAVVEKKCFYMTNIVPQNPQLNRGQWKLLEEHVRDLSKGYDSVLVITGLIYDTLNNEKFKIPTYFFKVCYIYKSKECEAYLIPNKSIVDYKIYQIYNFKIIGMVEEKLKKMIKYE